MTITSEIPVTDTYESVKRLIYLICLNFHHKYNVNLDDLLSEANLIFPHAYKKYDRKRGGFATLIHHAVFNRLKLFVARKAKRDKKKSSISNFDWRFTAAKEFNWKEFASELPKDARYVVHLIFEGPKEIGEIILKEGESKRSWIRALKSHLFDIGWSIPRIMESFNEVRKAL